MGVFPVAPFDYWELHIISLRSVSCNLMILLFSCTHSCTHRRQIVRNFWSLIFRPILLLQKLLNMFYNIRFY